MSNLTYTVTRLSTEERLLSSEDSKLVLSFDVNSSFDLESFKIELHIYSLDNRLLRSVEDFRDYGVNYQNLNDLNRVEIVNLNPIQDAINNGYSNGDVVLKYNFLDDQFTKDTTRSEFYIDSISRDRTELKVLNLNLEDSEIVTSVEVVRNKLFNSEFIGEIVGNFRNDRFTRITNIRTGREGDKQFVFLKLYEPLRQGVNLKDTFYIDEEVANNEFFEVRSSLVGEVVVNPSLKGPNFNIEIEEEVSNPTDYLDINSLIPSITGSNYLVYSKFNELGIELSIDHSSFSNFVHFSSAQERLDNFKYKLGLIETYNSSSNSVKTSTASSSQITASLQYYNNLVEGVVNNFDHYERYLYFTSSSFSWPKVNDSYPYVNFATTSSEGLSFYNNLSTSASLYDETNRNRLVYTLPEFIYDDLNNQPYFIFLDMIGQHFDSLWIYSKAVTEKYNADNRLDYGISKDLVGDALRNFGIKLYGSNLSLDTLFSMYAGEIPNTGSENIETYISASNTPISQDNYSKEVLKRVYHNLPLLLKSKGTERGLRALINCFGIPYDILDIRYYGGTNKTELPYYGPGLSYTSSLDRIRLSNTGSIVNGDLVSYNTSLVKNGNDYSQDLHTIEVGFSPTTFIDNELSASVSSTFNLDDYIGDPRQYTSSYYQDLVKVSKPIFDNIDRYNVKDFIRQVKFYNNSLFRMIRDFTPARTNLNTGVIIKPNILNRSKVKQVHVSFTQPEYSGSLSIGSITGSNPGAFKTVTTEGLEYDTSYTFDRVYSTGTSSTTVLNGYSKFTGEFSGSRIVAADGELNRDNTIKYTDSSTFAPNSDYDVLVGSIQNVKRSNRFLRLDREEDYIQPKNSDFLTGSFVEGYRNSIDESAFSLAQDTNFDTISWNRIRYSGTKNTYNNLRAYFPFTRLEPFQGSVYSLSALSSSIQNVVDTSRRVETLYFGGDPALLATQGSLSDNFVEVTTTITGTTTTVTATLRNYQGVPVTEDEDITVTYQTKSTGPKGTTFDTRYVTISSGNSTGNDSFINQTLEA